MPFPRPIDSTLHGATDYTLGTLLMTALPRVAGVEGTESATQMRVTGAAHAAYSTLTDYPLGIEAFAPLITQADAAELNQDPGEHHTVAHHHQERDRHGLDRQAVADG